MPLRASIFLALPVLVAAGAVVAQTPEQVLGRSLYFDEILSLNQNQACASCHHPDAGFADPRNAADPANLPVSPGSVEGLFGGRNAPSAAYARFSPTFQWNGDEGLYAGGQFWDGRADTLMGQALGPPTNPVEMALPDKRAVVEAVAATPAHVAAFSALYGIDLTEAIASDSGVLATYDRMAKAVGEYEKDRELAEFSSKFDYWLAGEYVMTAAEAKGFKLFNGKGKCAPCHLSEPQVAADGTPLPPLFTDFTYDNLGIPVNPRIAELAGPQPIDYGLGARAVVAAVDPIEVGDGVVVSAGQAGKFKVMGLRNIERTAPYGHNGFFATLEGIVHFYNTRDALPECDDVEAPEIGVTCWPEPEVELNVNTSELGDLRLTAAQEADLVAFLRTLTDGHGPPRPVALPPSP